MQSLPIIIASAHMDAIKQYELADYLLYLLPVQNIKIAQFTGVQENTVDQIYGRSATPEEMDTLKQIFSQAPFAIGAPKKALLEVYAAAKEHGNQIVSPGIISAKVASMFGNSWHKLLYKINNNLQEMFGMVMLLPQISPKYIKQLTNILETQPLKKSFTVFRNWNNIPDNAKNKSFEELLKYAWAIQTAHIYDVSPEIVDPEFAQEYSRWDYYDDDDAHELTTYEKRRKFYPTYNHLQNFYNRCKKIKLPIWADVNQRFKYDDYVGRFLPRSDPRGLFLGEHVENCLHPRGAASSTACYCASNPDAAFFVIENKKGDIVASSAVWTEFATDTWNKTPDNIIFDSIDIHGGLDNARKEMIASIYKQAANFVANQADCNVRVGGYAGLALFPENHQSTLTYNNLPFYSDARITSPIYDHDIENTKLALEQFNQQNYDKAFENITYQALLNPLFAQKALEFGKVNKSALPHETKQVLQIL